MQGGFSGGRDLGSTRAAIGSALLPVHSSNDLACMCTSDVTHSYPGVAVYGYLLK